MKKLNKNGALLVPTMFIWIFAATGLSAIPLAQSHRENKAVQYCMDEGKDDCHAFVSAMSKTEVLAYIKDTQERPRF